MEWGPVRGKIPITPPKLTIEYKAGNQTIEVAVTHFIKIVKFIPEHINIQALFIVMQRTLKRLSSENRIHMRLR